jgi:hypothetical protein
MTPVADLAVRQRLSSLGDPSIVGIFKRGTMSQQSGSPNSIYRISVRNILDEGWVRALQINPIATYRHYAGTPRTILTLQIRDQSELLGLLNQLHGMGLTLLAVELRPSDATEE